MTSISELIEKFDPVLMDFLLWLNCFEYIIDFLHIPDNLKAFTLVNMLHVSTIELIQKKISPDQIQNLSYDKLIDIMVDMFTDYQGEYIGRYRFETRRQMNSESVRHYAETLMKFIKKCKFSNDEDEILLDQFIIGLKSQRAKNTLSEIKNLTLDIAINLTESIESFHDKYFLKYQQ